MLPLTFDAIAVRNIPEVVATLFAQQRRLRHRRRQTGARSAVAEEVLSGALVVAVTLDGGAVLDAGGRGGGPADPVDETHEGRAHEGRAAGEEEGHGVIAEEVVEDACPEMDG